LVLVFHAHLLAKSLVLSVQFSPGFKTGHDDGIMSMMPGHLALGRPWRHCTFDGGYGSGMQMWLNLYERNREEIADGRSPQQANHFGYDSAIF